MDALPIFFASRMGIGCFFMLSFLVSCLLYARKRNPDFDESITQIRHLPTEALVMTLLATYLDQSIMDLAGFSFFEGISSCLYFLSEIFSFFFFAFVVTNKLRIFHDSLTMGDLMGRFYGNAAQWVTGWVNALLTLLILVMQLIGVGMISAYFLDVSPGVAIAFFGYVLVVRVLCVGFSAMSYAYVWQMSSFFIGLTWLCKVIVANFDGLDHLFKKVWTFRHDQFWLNYTSFWNQFRTAFFWIFSGIFLLSPPIFQRMLIVEDKRQVRKMWYVGTIFYALIAAMLLLVSAGGIIIGAEDPNLAGLMDRRDSGERLLMQLVRYFFGGHGWLMVLMFFIFLSVLVATMDAYLHAFGVIVVRDLVGPVRR